MKGLNGSRAESGGDRRRSTWVQLLTLKNLQQFRILQNRSIRSNAGVETR